MTKDEVYTAWDDARILAEEDVALVGGSPDDIGERHTYHYMQWYNKTKDAEELLEDLCP